MTLIRYKDFDDMPTPLSRVLDRFLKDSLNEMDFKTFKPKANILEDENNFEIHLEVPGIKKEDLNLEVDGNILTIKGEKKIHKDDESKEFHRIETNYGAFSRTFQMPETVNDSEITASYNNGILRVSLPKDKKSELKTTIKVK